MVLWLGITLALIYLAQANVQQVPSPPWIAAFLNSTEQARCRQLFIRDNHNPEHVVNCEHHTIVFNPPSLKPFEPHFGEKQLLRVLGQARDTHDHALLVHLDQGSLHTLNLYPHITVFCGPEDPYTAVYSNVLWERFNDDAPLVLHRDAGGYPESMSLSTGGDFWFGKLPAFHSKQFPLPNNTAYEATKGLVEIFEQTPQITFHATVCLNTDWDGDNCNVKK